jgi:hypothetical protein
MMVLAIYESPIINSHPAFPPYMLTHAGAKKQQGGARAARGGTEEGMIKFRCYKGIGIAL